MIVCALDVAYINATAKNSNDCLNQFFGNIKGLPGLLSQCVRWSNPDGNSFGKAMV